jgi:hypothetical protein
LLLLALFLVPLAEASWSTSASVPASFRPGRAVTFSYTAQSSSGTDLPLQWGVRLLTCRDTTADGLCTASDASYTDRGEQTLSLSASQSATLTWSVTEPGPEATYTYNFNTRCTLTPCTGQPAGGSADKRSTYLVQYTNTWTRTLTVPSTAPTATTQTVSYQLTSTSVDDLALAGTATLYSRPTGTAETAETAKPYSVAANSQVTLTWNVAFTSLGPQQERLNDTYRADLFANATVFAVHLHVQQPRASYAPSSIWSLYVTLEGHNGGTLAAPLSSPVTISLRNGTFPLGTTMPTTDANGQAYVSFVGAADSTTLNWTANSTGSWLGYTYAVTATGTVTFQNQTTTPDLSRNVSDLQQSVDDLALHGVHLDDVGEHNLLLTTAKAALGAALFVGVVALIVVIGARV